jgi:oligoendopeptidase F
VFTSLPADISEFMRWSWPQIEPYYRDLIERSLNPATVADWLADWTQLVSRVQEIYKRLYIATTVDTTDQESKNCYAAFLDHIYQPAEAAEQKLKEKLLACGMEPFGFEMPLRNLRAEAVLFRQENLPLSIEELKLNSTYYEITAAQTVDWEGKEVTLWELQPVFLDLNRERREKVWRLSAARQLTDRAAINELWIKLLNLRLQQADNAGFSDYRAYRWQQLQRFDYTPQDCRSFHQAIEKVVVPAAARIYEKRRKRLELVSLRPWDLNVDPFGLAPLLPFSEVEELEEGAARIFSQVDPQLGKYFDVMRRNGLLDLGTRKNKAPAGYCEDFALARQPFIFMTAVGVNEDVLTLLHEGGHAFHVFESAELPYYHQMQIGSEIAEAASMSMELLASPYLTAEKGGFYSTRDAARARIDHLESIIRFWPYMTVVDAFQHWVYENPRSASDPKKCDQEWAGLWQRYMIGVDWSGLEEEMMSYWQRQSHIHQVPYYYIEYGLAQLGAVQIWQNSLHDKKKAVTDYRMMLSLGGSRPLPDLFAAGGAKFAFDEQTLQTAVKLLEATITSLEQEFTTK